MSLALIRAAIHLQTLGDYNYFEFKLRKCLAIDDQPFEEAPSHLGAHQTQG